MHRNLVALFLSLSVLGSDCFSFVTKKSRATHTGTTTTITNKPTTTQLSASALILQNKGGGHGELGYQLAKNLLSNSQHHGITDVTIVQDEACKRDKEPFCSYESDLAGTQIIYAPISDDDAMTTQFLQSDILKGRSFDYIWDNASKGPVGIGKALIECASSWADRPKLFCYVSSAGMYNPSKDHGRNPLLEDTTPVKTTAGQHLYDQYAVAQNLPLVSFRPQYIYGPKSNKFDYLDYFFDRLVRNLPIPIPGDGDQLVSLTNAIDVASLLASPLNNERGAIDQRYFNCGTDRLISYRDVAYACADAARIPRFNVKIEYYDPDALGTKGAFPFRMTDFFVVPDKAQQILKWEGPSYNVVDDLCNWYFQDYLKRGGPTKKISFMKDWEIVVGCKTSLPQYVSSIYEKYDPLPLTDV